MRELEKKLRFVDLSEASLIEALALNGIDFDPPVQQTDVVFAKSAEVITRASPGSVVARVREDSREGSSLTVKERRRSELDRSEFEVAVSNFDAAVDILRMLGYREILKINKTRRKATIEGLGSVLIDAVDNLGIFVEIEVLSNEDDAEDRLEALTERISDSLGQTPELVLMGYDRLLLKKLDQS